MPVVVVPWRGGDSHREAAFAWVRARYEAEGWNVVVGEHSDGEWCKAAAVADGLAQTDADVIVMADADVWTDGLPAAVAAVERGGSWAIPHLKVHRLSEESTAKVLGGAELSKGLRCAQTPYTGLPGGGLVVVRRDVIENVPIDGRMVGWGSEDEAWALALTALVGPPWRLTSAPCWHLWHEPQERKSRAVGNDDSHALLKRYKEARKRPAAMLELVEEAKCQSTIS